MFCHCCYPLNFSECFPCGNGLCLFFLFASCISDFCPFFSFSSSPISSFFSPGAAADTDLFLLFPFLPFSTTFHVHLHPLLPKRIALFPSLPDLPIALSQNVHPLPFFQPPPLTQSVLILGKYTGWGSIYTCCFWSWPSVWWLACHLWVNEQL